MGIEVRPAVLDTSVVIALTQQGEVLTGLEDFDPLFVSSVTYAELHAGLSASPSVDIALRRQAALDRIGRLLGPGLPFDDACATAYAAIVRAAVAQGSSFRANQIDRMIAAVAAANGLPLLTMNAADLRGLDTAVEVVDLGIG